MHTFLTILGVIAFVVVLVVVVIGVLAAIVLGGSSNPFQ